LRGPDVDEHERAGAPNGELGVDLHHLIEDQ
jgi:hypothetical protein